MMGAKKAVSIDRRGMLAVMAAALAPATVAAQEAQVATSDTALDAPQADLFEPEPEPAVSPTAPDWEELRDLWLLSRTEVDLAAMMLAANPKPVREAIERHRRNLDTTPLAYLKRHNKPLQNRARAAAGRYFGVAADNVALCESTTSGIGLLYNGLTLRPGDEVLTTSHDYYVTHESLRAVADRSGARVRTIKLFDDPARVAPGAIVARIIAAMTPRTRVLALTWVHSSTGLKMPLRAISDALAPINAARTPAERVLFCVDGVHGFGVENTSLSQLGCDFFVAGCHKWLFGPRGTGVVFGTPTAWKRVTPTVPTFLAPDAYGAWIGGHDPGPTTAARMTPGGFKAFEHVWSLTEAFDFHQGLGKGHVATRTHALAGRLKRGLSAMPHVRLHTPLDPGMSSGIVAFDVEGLTADTVVQRLATRGVHGSAAPYARRHVRLTPSIRNSPQEIDRALTVVAALRSARG